MKEDLNRFERFYNSDEEADVDLDGIVNMYHLHMEEQRLMRDSVPNLEPTNVKKKKNKKSIFNFLSKLKKKKPNIKQIGQQPQAMVYTDDDDAD